MKVCYNKLWKKLIDHGMTRTELRLKSGISSYALAKMGRGEAVTTAVLLKICRILGCEIKDIIPTKDIEHVKSRKIQKNHHKFATKGEKEFLVTQSGSVQSNCERQIKRQIGIENMLPQAGYTYTTRDLLTNKLEK